MWWLHWNIGFFKSDEEEDERRIRLVRQAEKKKKPVDRVKLELG